MPQPPALKSLPVLGYQDQPQSNVDIVNANKEFEEQLLRRIDFLMKRYGVDGRWCSIARTHIEQGFMALNRAVFNPKRIGLPGDQV